MARDELATHLGWPEVAFGCDALRASRNRPQAILWVTSLIRRHVAHDLINLARPKGCADQGDSFARFESVWHGQPSAPSTKLVQGELAVEGGLRSRDRKPTSAHNIVTRRSDPRVPNVARPVGRQRPMQKGNQLVSGITVEPDEDEILQHDRIIRRHLEHRPSSAIRAHIVLHGRE